jgi:hypothetical protein
LAIEQHGADGPGYLIDSPIIAEASARTQHLQQALVRKLRETLSSHGPLATGTMSERGPDVAGAVALQDDRLRELQGRLLRPETASALTLASFLPWLQYPDALRLAGIDAFRELHFDARCPTGVRGTPPHIDFMASGPNGVAGATVRTFDYLVHRPARISAAYAALPVPEGLVPWASLLRDQGSRRHEFRHVDVVALAKLAVGLGRIFLGRPMRLLYLYLEPEAAADLPPFRQHRDELERLVEATMNADVKLVAMTFHELWAEWQGGDTPPAVRGIAAELSRRYAVAITPAAWL